MLKKNTVTFDQVKTLVNAALGRFYREDRMLIDYESENNAVSERCMVFRIGWYMLEAMKEAPQFEWADLDCEYNRNFFDPKMMYIRRQNGSIKRTRNVVPDLLIHERRSNANNLLVIEFKKGFPSRFLRGQDTAKLKYFTNPNEDYRYSFGFYIELHSHCAEVQVFEQGHLQRKLSYIWELGVKE